MKTKIAAFAACCVLSAPLAAYAEFRVGGIVGSTSTSTNESNGSVFPASKTENGTGFGIFGQWRTAANNTMDVGVHLGYSIDSAGDKQDINVIRFSDSNILPATIEVEIDSVIDLMGVVAWKGGSVRPFIMAGYSVIKFDADLDVPADRFSESDDDSAGGWKIAIGAEFPLADSWSAHAMIDHANYGEIGLYEDDVEFDTVQTGIRFGVSYAF
ncbi:MAG: outer membrane protein [bacterium]